MTMCWPAIFVLLSTSNAIAGDAFDYPYFRPEAVRSTVQPVSKQTPSERRYYYREDHDFNDYSMHYTRTDPHSRINSDEPPPSGPYFAYELKSYYHKRYPEEMHSSIYPTVWNTIDPAANFYQRPVVVSNQHQPKLTNNPAMDAWIQQQHLGLLHHQMQTKPLIALDGNYDTDSEYPPQQRPADRPVRKPVPGKRPNKKKKRPMLEMQDDYNPYQKHPNRHPNNVDKVSEGPQSIASAYPNGALGTLSLLAGVAWYLINRSATPVVKMRQHSDGNASSEEEDPFGVNHILDYWSESLRQSDCQQRAVCEIVAQSPLLSSATQWSRDLFETPMVQKVIESLKEEDDTSSWLDHQSKAALIVKAAVNGERGDCATLYPQCTLPFGQLNRDR